MKQSVSAGFWCGRWRAAAIVALGRNWVRPKMAWFCKKQPAMVIYIYIYYCCYIIYKVYVIFPIPAISHGLLNNNQKTYRRRNRRLDCQRSRWILRGDDLLWMRMVFCVKDDHKMIKYWVHHIRAFPQWKTTLFWYRIRNTRPHRPHWFFPEGTTYISGWWFGTWILWLSIQLGMK